jgi:acetyltransferase-like isoleucine patch superfamily enzyme
MDTIENQRRTVLLIGGRGLGRSLLDRLERDPSWWIAGIIDDGLGVKTLRGVPVYGFDDYPRECRTAIMAVSKPADKKTYRQKAVDSGLDLVSYVDATALVGSGCQIGSGCVILPFSIVMDEAELGEHVFVSCYCAVGKGARVGDYATIMNYSSVRGANVGAGAVLTTAVHVMDGAHVGEGCWVAPGTILRKPVPPGHLAWGAPPRHRPLPKRGMWNRIPELASVVAGEELGE